MNFDLNEEELLRLSSKLLDGVISDEEHMRLNDLLTNSRRNRQFYLEVVRMESLLHWEPSCMDLPEAEEIPPNLIPFPLFTWVGTIAATIVAMVGVWWAFLPNLDNKSQVAESKALPFSTQFGEPVGFANASESPSPSPVVSPIKTKVFNGLNVRQSVQEQVQKAIEVLRSDDRSAEGGVFEFHGLVKRWNRTPIFSIPSEKGVLPSSGSVMFGFDKMLINVESQIAHVEETVQVLDVREALKNTNGVKARIFAAVKVNQSFGETQEGAEFGLTFQAFKDEGGSSNQALARVEKNLPSDRDPSTWNEISSEFEIPADAEYIAVSLSVKKYGPDSLLANTSNYYSDDLELSLLLGDQSIIGPI
jgi:hypothetical protein